MMEIMHKQDTVVTMKISNGLLGLSMLFCIAPPPLDRRNLSRLVKKYFLATPRRLNNFQFLPESINLNFSDFLNKGDFMGPNGSDQRGRANNLQADEKTDHPSFVASHGSSPCLLDIPTTRRPHDHSI